MKKILFTTALFTIIAFGVQSQNPNQVAVRLSFNQFEMGYQRQFIRQKIWAETYIGVGNQDINAKYDDFVTGLRIGRYILANEKNALSIAAGIGLYFPNNHYYKATTPVYSGFIAYNLFLGKSKKHSLLANLGYQYGKKDYTQEYSNNGFYAATTGSFKVSPVYFSLGYGFHF